MLFKKKKERERGGVFCWLCNYPTILFVEVPLFESSRCRLYWFQCHWGFSPRDTVPCSPGEARLARLQYL